MNWYAAGRLYHGAYYQPLDRFAGSNEPDDDACDVCQRTEPEGASLSVWFANGATDTFICDDCRASDPERETGDAQ